MVHAIRNEQAGASIPIFPCIKGWARMVERILAGFACLAPDFFRAGSRWLPWAFRGPTGGRRRALGCSGRGWPLVLRTGAAWRLEGRRPLQMASLPRVSLGSCLRPGELAGLVLGRSIALAAEGLPRWGLSLFPRHRPELSKANVSEVSAVRGAPFLLPLDAPLGALA